ncbi:MAG: hypothetical protein AAGB12_15875 [Pseudomonadota bacterium]
MKFIHNHQTKANKQPQLIKAALKKANKQPQLIKAALKIVANIKNQLSKMLLEYRVARIENRIHRTLKYK